MEPVVPTETVPAAMALDNDQTTRERALSYALGRDGAYAEHPWGQTVVKVNKKVFLFINGAIAPEDGVSLSVKLPETGEDLLSMPFAEPMGYGMGRHGWVTLLLLHADAPPSLALHAWIDESYRAIAPKRTRRAPRSTGAHDG